MRDLTVFSCVRDHERGDWLWAFLVPLVTYEYIRVMDLPITAAAAAAAASCLLPASHGMFFVDTRTWYRAHTSYIILSFCG